MPKIKLTKSELKKQRDSLKQFLRFLPTLQLKKQQLQLETRKSQERITLNTEKEMKFKSSIASWIDMFGSQTEIDQLVTLIKIKSVNVEIVNIAGVDIPSYNNTIFEVDEYNLATTPPWWDDAICAIMSIIEIREERKVLVKQFELISTELQTTTQRVNLFEKVKIPECKENIKKIQIYLGDQQTTAVGRSKIAKKKLAEAYQ